MTSSVVETEEYEQIRQRVYMALFVALAVGLYTMEVLLPNPVPWFRIGLANILGLTALFCYGVRAMWTVNLLRIFVGNLLMGSLFAPGFLLSLGGGLLATGLMSVSFLLWKGKIGPVGISVLGALGHVSGQIVVAWLVVVRHPSILMLLPIFLIFALISGIVNGLAADYLIELLKKRSDKQCLACSEELNKV